MGISKNEATFISTEIGRKGLVAGPASALDGAIAVFNGTGGKKVKGITPATHVAALSIAAVAGVDGVGSNAASKADVDLAFADIVTKLNAVLTSLEAIKVRAAS